jgi:hypothetical protein
MASLCEQAIQVGIVTNGIERMLDDEIEKQ